MAHPLTDILKTLLVAQHEVGESLSPTIQGRISAKVKAHSLGQWPLKIARFNYL